MEHEPPIPNDLPAKPWLVELSCRSELLLADPLEFELSDLRVRVVQDMVVRRYMSNQTFTPQEVIEPIGLRFRVQTPPSRCSQAFYAAEVASRVVSRLLAVVHGTAVPSPKFDVMVDLLPKQDTRMLLQALHSIPTRDRPRPRFDAEFMVEVFHYWRSIKDAKTRKQVDLAFANLQASYEADNSIVQFSDLWAGISSLNEVLRNEYEIEEVRVDCAYCKTPTLFCSGCGRPRVQLHYETAVIRGIICDRLGHTRAYWKKLNEMRQKIAHGGDIPDLERVHDAVQTLREALSTAIAQVLGLPTERHLAFVSGIRKRDGADDLWVVIQLERFGVEALKGDGPLPRLRVAEGGLMLSRTATKGKFRVPFAMYGHRGPYKAVDVFVRPGSSLLEEIEPVFVTGGAPGEGAYAE